MEAAAVKGGSSGFGERTGSDNRFVFILLAAVFVLNNTIFVANAVPGLHVIGSVDLLLQDILIFALMAAALYSRSTSNSTVVYSPLTKYVVIFIGVLCVVIAYSVIVLHQSLISTLVTFRSFYGYLLFFPVVWALGTRSSVRKIIILWVVISAVGVAIQLFQFYFGELSVFQRYEWLYSRIRTVTTGGGRDALDLGYYRFLTPGRTVFYTILFVAIAMWLLMEKGWRRWLWGFLAAVIGLQMITLFARGAYITTLATLVMLPLVVRDRRARKRLLGVLAVMVLVALAMVAYKSATVEHGTETGLLEFATERLLRGITHSGEDVSVQGRVQAWELFLTQLRGHWLLGLGLGSGLVYGDNTYLSFLIKTGVAGLIAFLVLYGRAVVRGWRHFRYLEEPFDRAVLLGLWLSTVRHLVNGITQADFTVVHSIPALIVTVALMEVLIINTQRERLGEETAVTVSSQKAARPVLPTARSAPSEQST